MVNIQEDNISIIIIIGMAGMFILAVALVLFVLIYKKKIVEEQLINQENLIQSAIAIQEEERKRFAADLHDQIGGGISTILLSLSGIENDIASHKINNLKNKTLSIRKQLNDLVRNVREISHNITPQSLENYGLVATLNDLCFQVQDSDQIDAHFIYDGEELPLSFSQELAIYRICKELIANTIKHAKASEIYLSLFYSENQFEMIYKDNGIGFSEKLNSHGSGLKNINNRAQVIRAKLITHNSITKGMEARLTLTI